MPVTERDELTQRKTEYLQSMGIKPEATQPMVSNREMLTLLKKRYLDDLQTGNIERYKQTSFDEYTPDVVRMAFNKSLTGMAYQLAEGKPLFNLNGYQSNVIEDIASEVLSFIMPLDAATMAVGGGAVRLGASAAKNLVVKKLIANGVAQEVAERAVTRAASRALPRTIEAAAKTGGALGAYGTAGSAAGQKVVTGDIDWSLVAKDGLKSGALGLMLGAVGGFTAPWGKRIIRLPDGGYTYAPVMAGKAAQLGAEIGTFTGGGAAMEGRLPTSDDLQHAVGLVLGLKLQGIATNWVRSQVANRIMEKYLGGTPIEEATDEVMQDNTVEDILSKEPAQSKAAREKAQADLRAGKEIEIPDDLDPQLQQIWGLSKTQTGQAQLRDELLNSPLGYKASDIVYMGGPELAYWVSGGRLGWLPQTPRTKGVKADAERISGNQARPDRQGEDDQGGEVDRGGSVQQAAPEAPDLAGAPARQTVDPEAIAAEHDAVYDGMQERPKGKPPLYTFTDNVTGTTVMIDDPAKLPVKLADKRQEFEKAKDLTYEEFKKQYTDAFKSMNKYTVDQVGRNEFADQMAALADRYPDWADKVEAESGGEASKPPVSRETPKFTWTKADIVPTRGGVVAVPHEKPKGETIDEQLLPSGSLRGTIGNNGLTYQTPRLSEREAKIVEEKAASIGLKYLGETEFRDGTISIDFQLPKIEGQPSGVESPETGTKPGTAAPVKTADVRPQDNALISGRLDEEIAAEYGGIHPKSVKDYRAAMEKAPDDPEDLIRLLHPDNKNLRKLFEDETGIDLPKQVGKSADEIWAWKNRKQSVPLAKAPTNLVNANDVGEQDFNVPWKDGDYNLVKTVKAKVIPDFEPGVNVAVHRNISTGPNDPKAWTVSHLESGRAIAHGQAEQLAKKNARDILAKAAKDRGVSVADLVKTVVKATEQKNLNALVKEGQVEKRPTKQASEAPKAPGGAQAAEIPPSEKESEKLTVSYGSTEISKVPGPAGESITRRLINRFKNAFNTGREPKTPVETINMARETDPKLTADKDNDRIYDAMEAGVARYYHELANRHKPSDFESRLNIAKELEDRLPTRRRTLEAGSLNRQQFSTPLTLAEGMHQAADAKESDIVFEPTAGTGNLVAPFREGTDIRLNELHDIRNEILDVEYNNDAVDRVSKEDYLRMKPGFKPTLIVMNPPWGTAGRSKLAQVTSAPDLATSFVDKALRDLAPGGRLVALMPETILKVTPNAMRWRNELARNYRVRAYITSPEGAYTKGRGTDIGSVMLVVDKIDPAADTKPVVVTGIKVEKGERINLKPTWDEWKKLLAEIPKRSDIKREPERIKGNEPTTAKPGRPVSETTQEPVQRPLPSTAGRPVGESGGAERPASGSPERLPVRPESATSTEVVAGNVELPSVGGRPEGIHAGPGGLPERKPRRATVGEVDSPTFARYVSSGPSGTGSPHPRTVVITKQAASLGLPDISKQPIGKHLSDLVARKQISDEQADFVLRGELANDRGKGFVQAHDVGVGKTRVAAGVVATWLESGKAKRVLYVTANSVLIQDAIKEFNTIFGGKFPYRIIDIQAEFPDASSSRTKVDMDIPAFDKTVYMVTADGYARFHDKIMKVKFDGLIGDECHKFRNPMSIRGNRWMALHRDLIDRNARIQYLSATPARDIEEQAYLYGLREWVIGGFETWMMRKQGENILDPKLGTGLSAAEIDAAFQKLKKGGSAFGGLQKPDKLRSSFTPKQAEQINREWTAKGFYLATDLWREGIEFNMTGKELMPAEKEAVHRAVLILRELRAAYHKYKGIDKTLASTFGIEANIQNLVKDTYFNIRMKKAIDEAQEALKRGEQPVISVIRVRGEATEEGVLPDPEEGIDRKRGLPAYLVDAIERIPTEMREFSEDGQVLNLGIVPEAELAKQNLYENAATHWPKLDHPVSLLQKAFGEDNVAVITGSYSTPDGRIVNVSPTKRRVYMQEFQDGKRKVAIISRAGKTGISLHDVNGKRRHLIVTDYEWGADTFKQEMGRVDRAKQKSPAKITVLHFNSAAEKRFIGALANRMRDLGATAKGSEESTGTRGLEDFEIGGPLDYLTLGRFWEKYGDDYSDWFTHIGELYDGQGHPVDRIMNMDANLLKKFWRSFQTMPVDIGNRVVSHYEEIMRDLEREEMDSRLNELIQEGVDTEPYRKAFEEGKSFRQIMQERHETGDVLREAPLGKDMFLHQVKAVDGSMYGVLTGLVTDHLPELSDLLPKRGGGGPGVRQTYIDFHSGDRTISGLVIRRNALKTLADRFSAEGFGSRVTIENYREALDAGDKVDLANGWAIKKGTGGARVGKYILTGPKLTDMVEEVGGNKRMKFGLLYNPAGFMHIPEGELDAFVRDRGLALQAKSGPKGEKPVDLVDPNNPIVEMHAGIRPQDLFPGREQTLRRELTRTLGGSPSRLPTVAIEQEAKDLGISRFVNTPSFIFGAIPGMKARFGKSAQEAMKRILLAETNMRITQAQREDYLLKIRKKIPKEDWGKVGEKFVQLFDGRPIEEIESRTDITPATKEAARELREFFKQDRDERNRIIRGWYAGPIRRIVEQTYRAEHDLRGRRFSQRHRMEIDDLVRQQLDEIAGENWGIRDYLPHIFPGEFKIFRIDEAGEKEWVTSARTKIEALTKIAQDYADVREAGLQGVMDYRVEKRLFVDPDVVRVTGSRRGQMIDEISEAAEVDKADVRNAMNGKIGLKETKQKRFGSWMKREGYSGYSEDVEFILRHYNAGFTRWKYLSQLIRDVQPLVQKTRNEGRGRAADYLDQIFQQLWGYQSESSRAFDAFVQKLPWIQDRVQPFALERWLTGPSKNILFTGLLKWSAKYHVTNRLQTFQTLLPLVTIGGFVAGRRLYNSAEGKQLLKQHGIRYLVGGKAVEAGEHHRLQLKPEIREKARGFAPETFNQEVAFLTMYSHARELGMAEKAAADYALLRGNLFSQFMFLGSDRPAFTRGPIRSTVFLFQRFNLKNIELGAELWSEKDYNGMARWMAMPLLLGGARSASWLSDPVMGKLGFGYLPYMIYKRISDETNQTFADFCYFGLPSLIGLDMSYSFDLVNIPPGDNMLERIGNTAIGPVGSLTYRTWKTYADTKGTVASGGERAVRGLVQSMPGLRWMLGLERIFNGVDEGKYDFRSPSGKLQFEGDLRDVIIQALGGRSIDPAVRSLKFDSATALAEERDKVLDAAVLRWLDSGIQPSSLTDEAIIEWNAKWPEWMIWDKNVRTRKDARSKSSKKGNLERGTRKEAIKALDEHTSITTDTEKTPPVMASVETVPTTKSLSLQVPEDWGGTQSQWLDFLRRKKESGALV